MKETSEMVEREDITPTSYKETVNTTGQDGDSALDTTTLTVRRNIVMDGLGRVVSYKEDYYGAGE